MQYDGARCCCGCSWLFCLQGLNKEMLYELLQSPSWERKEKTIHQCPTFSLPFIDPNLLYGLPLPSLLPGQPQQHLEKPVHNGRLWQHMLGSTTMGTMHQSYSCTRSSHKENDIHVPTEVISEFPTPEYSSPRIFGQKTNDNPLFLQCFWITVNC